MNKKHHKIGGIFILIFILILLGINHSFSQYTNDFDKSTKSLAWSSFEYGYLSAERGLSMETAATKLALIIGEKE